MSKRLIVDSPAPVPGILSTFFFSIPKDALGVVLSFVCGCFIYIGASVLLAESHHAYPKLRTTIMALWNRSALYCHTISRVIWIRGTVQSMYKLRE